MVRFLFHIRISIGFASTLRIKESTTAEEVLRMSISYSLSGTVWNGETRKTVKTVAANLRCLCHPAEAGCE